MVLKNSLKKQQNHRTVAAGRDKWWSSVPTPAQAGTPRAGCPGPRPGSF